jgi:hypothetical protein
MSPQEPRSPPQPLRITKKPPSIKHEYIHAKRRHRREHPRIRGRSPSPHLLVHGRSLSPQNLLARQLQDTYKRTRLLVLILKMQSEIANVSFELSRGFRAAIVSKFIAKQARQLEMFNDIFLNDHEEYGDFDPGEYGDFDIADTTF